MIWRRQWQPTPVLLPGKSHGWKSLMGCSQSMGSLRVRYDWATSLSLITFMHWGRKWQPTPVLLLGESQGRRSLVGCRLWVAQSRTRLRWLSSSRNWMILLIWNANRVQWQKRRSVVGDGWTEGWTRTVFSYKEGIQMVINMHIKRCSILLIVREMQIKTTMRYHFISIRICLVIQLCPILCDPKDCSPPGSSVHGDSPGKNTWVGCHALL